MSLQAVILAAGEGTRLRPLTQNRPKALIPVVNIPILEHVIRSLIDSGIREIIVVAGYRKEQVMRHLSLIDLPLTVVVQKDQLGTADALLCAREKISGDVLVIPGDNYIDPASIREISEVKNALLYATHNQPSNFGVLTIEDDIVTGITEKPAHATRMTVSCGVYHLAHDLIRRITQKSMSEAVSTLLSEGVKITAIRAHCWQDAIYPWDLLAMNDKLIREITPGKAGTVSSSVVMEGLVSIGAGTKIHPGTVIYGPVAIGENCSIGPHAVIYPGTSIGSRVHIRPFSVIKNSIIMDDVTIASYSSITDSVLGEGCIIGEYTGTVSTSGFIILGSEPVRSACGVIMGNGVESGPSVLYENVVIGNDVTIEGKVKVHLSNRMIPDKTRVI